MLANSKLYRKKHKFLQKTLVLQPGYKTPRIVLCLMAHKICDITRIISAPGNLWTLWENTEACSILINIYWKLSWNAIIKAISLKAVANLEATNKNSRGSFTFGIVQLWKIVVTTAPAGHNLPNLLVTKMVYNKQQTLI